MQQAETTTPVRFMAIRNPESITEYTEPWDIETMRAHPDYVELDADGNSLRQPEEEREPWHFVFAPIPKSEAPKATRGRKPKNASKN